MRAPVRVLTTILAIALAALDVVLSAYGHSHHDAEHHDAEHHHAEHRRAAGSGYAAHSHCGHSHVCPVTQSEPSSLPTSDSQEEEDCSLCRHFNQPVAAASFELQLVGGQHVLPIAPLAESFCRAVFRAIYPARGPPVFVA